MRFFSWVRLLVRFMWCPIGGADSSDLGGGTQAGGYPGLFLRRSALGSGFLLSFLIPAPACGFFSFWGCRETPPLRLLLRPEYNLIQKLPFALLFPMALGQCFCSGVIVWDSEFFFYVSLYPLCIRGKIFYEHHSHIQHSL
jgi:hypothetical protein